MRPQPTLFCPYCESHMRRIPGAIAKPCSSCVHEIHHGRTGADRDHGEASPDIEAIRRVLNGLAWLRSAKVGIK